MRRFGRAGLSFKLFWVGLAQLAVVLVAIMALGLFVARRAARWDVPTVMGRVEPAAEHPDELPRLLREMRSAGGPPISIYDARHALVASDVDPPLALPDVTFEPPRPGAHHPHPPPGAFAALRRALLGRQPPRDGHTAALHLPLPNGMGTLVLEPAGQFLGSWLLLLSVLASVVAMALGAYLTARFIVRPLVQVEKDLVANVAHELRTPLSRIRVALDIAGEGDAATARASLADIDLDLAELEGLIDDVLTTARLELAGGSRGGLRLNLQSVPSATLVDESVARFRIRHSGRELELARDPELPELHADPVLLRRALDNLLENADKYSPDGTKPIALEVRRRGNQLTFEVRDHGIGISRRDLARVFSPFFRAERSRTRLGGGVGLGLTLAKQVIEAHGGTIRLESEPGAGTRAHIALPLPGS